jgi:hypothetical protein
MPRWTADHGRIALESAFLKIKEDPEAYRIEYESEELKLRSSDYKVTIHISATQNRIWLKINGHSNYVTFSNWPWFDKAAKAIIKTLLSMYTDEYKTPESLLFEAFPGAEERETTKSFEKIVLNVKE